MTKIYRACSMALAVLLMLVLLTGVFTGQASAKSDSCKTTYSVKPGDTIYKIAKALRVPFRRLIVDNKLQPPYQLTTGQKLCISDKPQVNKNVQWTANYDGKTVVATGSGFEPSTPFLVKVKGQTHKPIFTTLGSTTTSSSGNLYAWYPVGADLEGQPAVKICLKQAQSSYITCKKVYKR